MEPVSQSSERKREEGHRDVRITNQRTTNQNTVQRKSTSMLISRVLFVHAHSHKVLMSYDAFVIKSNLSFLQKSTLTYILSLHTLFMNELVLNNTIY